MNIIENISYHPLSTQTNCILFYSGEKLYRSPMPHFSSTLDKIIKLNNKTIQNTIKTQYHVFNSQCGVFTEVYEHKILPHLVRIDECTRKQAKKLILQLCELQIALTSNELVVYDIHENNIYLNGHDLIWVDVGAIVDTSVNINLDAAALYGYVKTCYLIVKYLVGIDCTCEQFNDVTLNDYSRLLDLYQNYDWNSPHSWDELKNTVNSIDISDISTHWSDFYPYDFSELSVPNNQKMVSLLSLMPELHDVNTALDIGCNKGLYTLVLAQNVKHTLGFDVDEKSIDIAEQYSKELNIPATFSKNTIDNIQKLSVHEKQRYMSDMSMALAMVHHLAIQRVYAQEFVDFISQVSKRYCIIEDIDSAQEYEEQFKIKGWTLIKRLSSTPHPRTISLYGRGYP